MWTILILLTAGFLMGYFLRKNPAVFPVSEKFTTAMIYALLFFMGLGVGVNPEIVSNLKSLGVDALIISLFAIMGSLLFAYMLNKLPGKDEK